VNKVTKVYLQESESDWLANKNKGITGANKIPCKNSVTNITIVKATSVIINSGMICERICVFIVQKWVESVVKVSSGCPKTPVNP
jgi:hypothetical protein